MCVSFPICSCDSLKHAACLFGPARCDCANKASKDKQQNVFYVWGNYFQISNTQTSYLEPPVVLKTITEDRTTDMKLLKNEDNI